MGNGKVDLKKIEQNYPESYTYAFEDMATHMFMVKLNLSEPPLRRKNQRAIESDPVIVTKVNGNEKITKVFAYQAKYFEPNIELNDRKDQFLKSIRDACNPNITCGLKVTDMIFYVNKRLTQNSSTGEKSGFEKFIEDEAKAVGIEIHWYTCDRIETDLGTPRYRYIKEMFLCDRNTHDISGFYQYISAKMTDDIDSELFGNISLVNSYIEPSILDRNGEGQWSYYAKKYIGHNQSIREYLESWVIEKDFITIICGEPGHGKTSLCRKAMYDFYKSGWLENKVKNVFCLSINPVGTKVFDDSRLDSLDSLLSWENDDSTREDEKHKLSRQDCQNALLFLDGFDELLECIPGYNMEKFLDKVSLFLEHFAISSRPHIVITTRSMAISHHHERKSYPLGRGKTVPIKELALISERQQYDWIERYEKHIRDERLKNSIFENIDKSGLTSFNSSERKHNRKENNLSESYLDKYRKMYKALDSKDELKEILGVPIIFRMIVVAEYVPEEGCHPTMIYDDLFDATWIRHNVELDEEHDKAHIKRKLTRHALKVYADNGDSAETSDEIGKRESSWLYAFYTKHKRIEGSKQLSRTVRVGFLHKSFYEYFLACEILSWFQACMNNRKLCINGEEIVDFKDMLSILGRQKLSDEVLFSIKTLYYKMQSNMTCEGIPDNAFEIAHQILKETDGIISIPKFGQFEGKR